jgi:hypothetical protein
METTLSKRNPDGSIPLPVASADDPPFEAIRKLLDAYWDDEEDHFDENWPWPDNGSNHIAGAFREVAAWLIASGQPF